MRASAGREEQWDAPAERGDVSAIFTIIAAGPFLLPLIGVEIADVVFAVPFALLVAAAAQCLGTMGRDPARRSAWRWLALAAALGAGAALVGLVASVAGRSATAALYLGAGGSAALLAGMVALARDALAGAPLARLVDALLLCTVVGAVAAWFVAIPGFAQGDPVLTAVFVVDVAAMIAASLAAIARGRALRASSWWLAGACGAIVVGDGLVAVAAAGHAPAPMPLLAIAWAIGGYALAAGAAGFATPSSSAADRSDEVEIDRRWVLVRIVLPLAAVLTLPVIVAAIWLAEGPSAAPAIFFGTFFVAALALAFGRQAYLLVDHVRATARERRLRHDADRRNEELEALTGLATTMITTLEETPIVERGLGVLHMAARATSSALHVDSGRRLALEAAAGRWDSEHTWAAKVAAPDGAETVEMRGARWIARLPLATRGRRLGIVTFVRPVSAPFAASELELLRLLIDQLAVAIQNARDYREKLEQAIRDPLTGLYNRRFFFEALEKEVRRTERYGSQVSLVIFDVDEFKSINDTLGHAAGDDVLREIGRIAEELVRPVDSFARVGGEEFALLLPETGQLDALLVAERIRTAIARQTILPGRQVTVSGGVSSCPHDADTTEELQKRADDALYWAKRNGRNMCVVATEVVPADCEDAHAATIAHLHTLVAAIDAEHLQTRDHSENVAAYAVAVAQALGLEGERIVRLRRAALLHDIGKIAISASILGKPGPLDHDETIEVQRHAAIGSTMLAHAGLGEEALWVRHHHERIDGEGYPDGLAGERIPFEARVLFVADAFEAMTSDRPYRRGMGAAEAIAELRRHAGTQFDSAIVEQLAELVERGELTALSLRRESGRRESGRRERGRVAG